MDTREPGSSLGTGGMSTKIAAARTAHCAGIPCGILHGRYPERIFPVSLEVFRYINRYTIVLFEIKALVPLVDR